VLIGGAHIICLTYQHVFGFDMYMS